MTQNYRQDLASMVATDLVLPYQMVTGLNGCSVSKAAMISALLAAFDTRVVGCHSDYLATLPVEQKVAVSVYRADGSSYMNSALRSGRMPVKLPSEWHLRTLLESLDITMKRADVAAFKKSPHEFSNRLRNGLVSKVTKMITASAKKTVDRWRLLDDMTKAVAAAPPRQHETVLWRGEHTGDYFRMPDNKIGKMHLEHGERMKALHVGDSFVRPDFSSFSMSPVTASLFSGRACCIFKLLLPKDTPALFMESNTLPIEYEVILPPGMHFSITGVRRVESHIASGVGVTIYDMCIMSDRKEKTKKKQRKKT